MKIDLLVAEIGSTTTVVNAFNFQPCPKFIGQGQSPTSVDEGDVNIGLKSAIEDLAKTLGVNAIEYLEMIATSSAAGGLRMTVHGLVYDMTVRAAKEAALGAGANIEYITAGRLRDSDLDRIKDIDPNIILIAGGVDYGERDTALYNSQLISELNLNIPVIYAGNIENQGEVRALFDGSKSELYIVDNVYPKIDQLNIDPTRRIIQGVFEKHIIHGPGMEKVRDMVTGTIMPTPGAVMASSELLYDDIGDLLTVDVGGATTDIHSVTEGSEEISRILINPEPLAKRTVEGDLGVYVNMHNIVSMVGEEELIKELSITDGDLKNMIENYEPIPESEMERDFVEKLTEHAVITAIKRHAGRLRDLYGPGGKKTIAEGKDLTMVKTIVGTGGALSRLPNRINILERITSGNRGVELLPTKGARIVIDSNYIMASLGVMSKEYPEEALVLLKDSLGL
ncbi:MAG: DNA mismatch repair protein MutL [Tissierellia bacterium]|nr:DNA mismatch repair protein MutL [Tissierellia bacterium]